VDAKTGQVLKITYYPEKERLSNEKRIYSSPAFASGIGNR
jgi:hypothetical protein